MTTDWRQLRTLQDVAAAQAAGQEIQIRWNEDDGWNIWGGQIWQDDLEFRARPRQPKMKTVKMECWLGDGRLNWIKQLNHAKEYGWIRVPVLDIVIEIPEVTE